MNPEEQLLKEKALLLLSRERELWGLRKKHARVSAWLAVAQTLPEIVSFRSSGAVYPALSRSLIGFLKLQDVAFFEVRSGELRFLGGGRSREPVKTLGADALSVMGAHAGICNVPDSVPTRALADAVGLHRFMWYRIADAGDAPILIAAGYTEDKASFYPAFEQEEFGHFKSTGQLLSVLLRNAALAGAIDSEKRALEDLNETLELKVDARTEELARTNKSLGEALQKLQEKERRLNEDLEEARAFQKNILPILPNTEVAEFAAIFRPLEIVGGDVYDVTELAPNRFRVFVADVTGHGVQASMRTMVLKAEYERLKQHHQTPDSLLVELNERLTRSYPGQELVCTAVCFDLTLGERISMRYANAAHPPLIVATRGVVREIYEDGPFLGLSLGLELEGIDLELERGAWVFAYTDGLCDQVDASGRLFPVTDEALPAIGDSADVAETVARILARFDTFRGETPTHDDVVLLGMLLGRAP